MKTDSIVRKQRVAQAQHQNPIGHERPASSPLMSSHKQIYEYSGFEFALRQTRHEVSYTSEGGVDEGFLATRAARCGLRWVSIAPGCHIGHSKIFLYTKVR